MKEGGLVNREKENALSQAVREKKRKIHGEKEKSAHAVPWKIPCATKTAPVHARKERVEGKKKNTHSRVGGPSARAKKGRNWSLSG